MAPVAKKLPASQIANETPDSSRETSMYWPLPVSRRSYSAETAASAPYRAQTRSHIGTPIFTGSPPGVPVMLMRPERACAMMSIPGWSRSGPSWPQPDAAT